MRPQLDRASPVPLYHQIAESLRYQVATGEIAPGTVLPPLREAARLWGANLHTVRRAYTELCRAGVVTTRVARGSVVQPVGEPGARRTSPRHEAFLDRWLREARERHGLGPRELVALLERRVSPAAPPAPATVYVTECSATQSADLAAQLMARWRVEARPWPLDRAAPPAGRTVIATYFHFNDVRTRWTSRLADVHFLAIHPDPELARRLRPRGGAGAGPTVVRLCERDDVMLRNILADLLQVLPPGSFRVVPERIGAPGRWLARRRSREPVLFSPRLWGELSAAQRQDPRAFEARFVYASRDLDAIGSTLGWEPR